MADWIKIRIDLHDDPNVYRMSDELGIDCPTVVGHLIIFWGWMDRHTPDGLNLKLSDAVIDRKVGLPNFAQAMRNVEWLEGADGELCIPLFERHNGQSAKARSLEAEAKRLRRIAAKTTTQPVGHLSDKTTQESPTRKEKKRKEKIPPQQQQPAQQSDMRERVAMHQSWSPSPYFHDRCKMAGIPVHVIAEDAFHFLVGEFKSYWLTRNDKKTQSEWDHKLLRQLGSLCSSGKLKSAERKGESIRARDIETSLVSRSWAYE